LTTVAALAVAAQTKANRPIATGTMRMFMPLPMSE
jgi:hypothetical protein